MDDTNSLLFIEWS